MKNKVNNSFVKILVHKLVENREEEKILVELNEKGKYLLLYRYKTAVAEYWLMFMLTPNSGSRSVIVL